MSLIEAVNVVFPKGLQEEIVLIFSSPPPFVDGRLLCCVEFSELKTAKADLTTEHQVIWGDDCFR